MKGKRSTEWVGGLLDFDFVGKGVGREVLRSMDELAVQFRDRAAKKGLNREFPVENFRDLRKREILALLVPEEFGGKGLAALDYVGVLAVMALGDASTALAFNMHSNAILSINAMGTHEQKERLFAKVVGEGACIAALGSEPDLKPFIDGGVPRTTLVREGDHFILDGRKSYCSFGGSADLLYVVCRLENEVAFAVVDAHANGVRRKDDWSGMAMRSTASVTTEFQNVKIAEKDVIRAEDPALAMMLEIEFALGYGPIYLAIAAGAAAGALETAKKSLDSLLSREDGWLHPDVGSSFAAAGRLRTLIQPAWRTCQDAASRDPLGSFARAVAIVAAKAVACDAASAVAEISLRLEGGRGLSETSPVGQAFINVQAGQVMAFSPEQARNMLGRLMLGYAPDYIGELFDPASCQGEGE